LVATACDGGTPVAAGFPADLSAGLAALGAGAFGAASGVGELAAGAGALAAGTGAAAAGFASSSEMMRLMDARISSIEGSCAFAGWLISNST
jgi:X-X-X-Leu-X-X-Gly heptad repeat protein